MRISHPVEYVAVIGMKFAHMYSMWFCIVGAGVAAPGRSSGNDAEAARRIFAGKLLGDFA